MMQNLQVGQLAIFRDRDRIGIVRIELVRRAHVTGFPWRQTDQKFENRRKKVREHLLLGVMPAGADPTALADKFNEFDNRRATEARLVAKRHRKRIESALAEL